MDKKLRTKKEIIADYEKEYNSYFERSLHQLTVWIESRGEKVTKKSVNKYLDNIVFCNLLQMYDFESSRKILDGAIIGRELHDLEGDFVYVKGYKCISRNNNPVAKKADKTIQFNENEWTTTKEKISVGLKGFHFSLTITDLVAKLINFSTLYHSKYVVDCEAKHFFETQDFKFYEILSKVSINDLYNYAFIKEMASQSILLKEELSPIEAMNIYCKEQTEGLFNFKKFSFNESDIFYKRKEILERFGD